MKSLFPIQSRDFSILTCIESNVGTGTIYVASSSVHDDLIPETTQHIRGSFLIYGWALEPLRSTQHRLIGVKATFIAHLDMGGTSPLPSAICRLLSTELPTCIDRVQTYLRQNGCPPYIRRVAGKIIFESFDDVEKQYQIEFIAKYAPSARQYNTTSAKRNNTQLLQSMWCTDIRTHTSMYPYGYHIKTNSVGVRVEIRPDKMGIRIYTETEDMDGKTIHVEIVQNLSSDGKPPQFHWNNQPLYTEEELKQIKEEELGVKKKKKEKKKSVLVDNASSSSIVVNKGKKRLFLIRYISY